MSEKMSNELTGGADRRQISMRDAECGRDEEVVAYLYGETSDAEAASFTQHLAACASCRDEVAALGMVRGRIGEWRAEAVRLAPSPAMSDAASILPAAHSAAPPRRRSARAALREFFALAPWWMQAGTATAALAICVLAAFVFARAEVRWDEGGVALATGGRNASVKKTEVTIPDGVTQARVDALIANHAREVGALRQQLQQKETSLATAQEKLSAGTAAQPRIMTASGKPRPGRRRSNRGPSNRTSDSYLAGTNEEDLPQLYDLLRDVN